MTKDTDITDPRSIKTKTTGVDNDRSDVNKTLDKSKSAVGNNDGITE